MREIGIKLSAAEDKLSVADGKLKEAEVQMQLFKKEAESYKDEVKETHDKMEEENMRLSSDLSKLRLQEEAARTRVQETERERAALEMRVANLQAEVESGRREREEEGPLMSHTQTTCMVYKDTTCSSPLPLCFCTSFVALPT